MPGMDGFELAEFMRGSERARHIPIIFVTAGVADSPRRFRGYEAGAVDFIQKPIETDILRSKANVFFDLHQQRQQIEAQRDELEAAAQALRRADRHKDSFLAVLAHELRNPVAALSGGLHLLNKDIPPERAKDIRARMDRMLDPPDAPGRRPPGRLASQPGQDRSEEAKRIELNEVLQSAIEASQHNDRRRQPSRSSPTFRRDAIWLDADHTRLAQIVANLLNNAAKYTPPGGTVSLSATAQDGWAEIKVTDTGVGIPPDMQSKIFEIFAQVEDHLARPRAAWGSAWRWSVSWSRSTAGRSPSRAAARPGQRLHRATANAGLRRSAGTP
jgi:signal transduction histidine kinase